MTEADKNKFVVHKFGGTSVGDADCFANVSDLVAKLDAPRMAVVVSAMGGKPKVTDMLISLLDMAKNRKTQEYESVLDEIREKHRKVTSTLLPKDIGDRIQKSIETDLNRLAELLRAITIMRSINEGVVEFISGHGEIWSAKILTEVLSLRAEKDGKPYRYHFVDARDFLIVEADEDHGPFVQYEETTRKIQEIVQNKGGEERTHLVITGFICSTADGVMTTLKRDGSDFTAAICGRVLGASGITIWTDVSGVLSSDPRRVPESRYVPELSYEEAMELAYFGAKVIHPKTMAPAIVDSIPIYIKNTFEPEHPGTMIFHRTPIEKARSISNGVPAAKSVVSGFSTVDNLALFNIEGSGMVGVHGTSSRLFSALDRIKVNVVLIAQASSEHSICFAVPMNLAEEVKAAVDETFFKEIHMGLVNNTTYISPVSIIAAVGDNMNQTPGVCSRFFGALGRASINIMGISQGSSERNISAVVRSEDSAAALRAVHSAFFLMDQTISVGIVGLELENDKGVGRALLEQCNQQCEFLRNRYNVDIRVRAISTHSTSKMLLDSNGGITATSMTERLDEFEDYDDAKFLAHVCADHLPHWVIIDVSNSAHHVSDLYPTWISHNVHVISANLNVAALSTAVHRQRRSTICNKELTFDTEACLAIGVPIFSTLQNFLQTGDQVQNIELSSGRIFNSILQQAVETDDDLAAIIKQYVTDYHGAADLLECLSGMRSAKKAVLIARTLGLVTELENVDIETCWRTEEDTSAWDLDKFVEFLISHAEPLQTKIANAKANGQSLRLVSNVNAISGEISVRVAALDVSHPFATLAPMQTGFAFHTRRHSGHPVVITGPTATDEITAGTLFGSLLALARNAGAHDHGATTSH